MCTPALFLLSDNSWDGSVQAEDAQTPPALQTVVSLLLDVTTRAQMQLQLQSDAQHAAQQEHLKTKEASMLAPCHSNPLLARK
eukprot:5198950-Amphidinium_carterae.1